MWRVFAVHRSLAGGLHHIHRRTHYGNRRIACVGGTFGRSQALPCGLVNAGVFEVRHGEVVDTSVAANQFAMCLVGGRDAESGDRVGVAGGASTGRTKSWSSSMLIKSARYTGVPADGEDARIRPSIASFSTTGARCF